MLTRSPFNQSPPRVGVLGGGQLARMTAEAARELHISITILEQEAQSPAGQIVGLDHEIVGRWDDLAARRALASRVDLITLESEFVDAEVLQWLVDHGTPVYPGPATLRIVQDKLKQKQTLAAAGLPVPRFAPAGSTDELFRVGRELGWPLVLKTRRLGYDGHGNVTVESPSQVEAAVARLLGPAASGASEARLDLYAESFVPFVGELAVMVARGRDGSLAVYPVVETVQRDHICHEVIAPARLPESLNEQVAKIAVAAVEAVDAVGVIGVELFYLADGSVLVNELAPRPHNSGHYTIEACRTSQFTNHLRGVLGWPLGPVDLVAPGAAMVNLLGTRRAPANPGGVAAAQAFLDTYLHLYGKREVRPGRKMGHVTALGSSPEQALELARKAARCIVW